MLLEGETGDGWPPIIAAFPVFIRRSSPPHLSSCLAGRGGRSWGCSHVTDPAGRSGVRAGSAPDTCLLLTSRYRGAVTEKPSPLASSPQPSRPPTRRGRSLAGETQALPSGRTPRALAVGSGALAVGSGPVGRCTCGSVHSGSLTRVAGATGRTGAQIRREAVLQAVVWSAVRKWIPIQWTGP
jgi:hypothetical protein